MTVENEIEAQRDMRNRPRRVESRVERFPFWDAAGSSADRFSDLLERLNELGAQGWLVVAVDLTEPATQHPGVCHCPDPRISVLMQREIED